MSWDERVAAGLRWGTVVVLLLAVVWVGERSWRWPVVGDAAVMHYVNLLMDRGLRPYAEITDNNMPGAYLVERWGMAVVGRGDVGWRVWDALLLLGMGAGMVLVVGRRRWWAAAFATGLFAVMNGAAGPMFAAEREQVVTMLLLMGVGSVFVGVRRGWPWLWTVGGFALGLAGTVKPTFLPLGVLVLAWGAVTIANSSGALLWRYVTAGGAGLLAAVGLVGGWLVGRGGAGGWWFVERWITPAYVGMAHAGWGEMAEHVLAPGTVVLAGVGLVLWRLGETRRERLPRAETGALLLVAGWGFLSYWAQGKGFLHHRYTLEISVLLLAGTTVDGSLRRQSGMGPVRAARWLGVGAVVLVWVGIVPHYLRAVDRVPRQDALLEGLVGDLEEITGAPGQTGVASARLDRKVMCLDLVYGCLAALDRMGVRETAGFTGDLMLWEGQPSGPREFYRAWFGRVMRDERPELLVVSNEWFGRANSFRKLEAWPEFARELETAYVEVRERRFPTEYGVAVPWGEAPGYRLYVRRGSKLAQATETPGGG